MKKLAILGCGAVLAISGCTTLPPGPDVTALPGSSSTLDQFEQDQQYCQGYAMNVAGGDPNRVAENNAVNSAAVGTLLGAAAGALIGAAAGDPGTGAAIGAGVGLVGGGAAGADAYNISQGEMQRRVDNAYVQCMY